jgi:predicted transcriptional regulator
MEVPLTPELQSKLLRMAEQQGRDSTALVAEAVERLVNYDAWFVSEVEKGLAAADRGELTDHQAVRALIDRRYPA